MRLVEITGDKFIFEFSPDEMDLLLFVLNDYPLIPETHHRLRKTETPEQNEDQKLLEEALRAQRLDNKNQLQSILNQNEKITASKEGLQIFFNRGEIELLLQILNDVRIGSWIALGSPGYDEEEKYIQDNKSTRYFITMQLCGEFQSLLLRSLHGEPPTTRK